MHLKSGAAVAELYRYQIVACLVTSSSPVPPKTRRVGQRCTLNLSRAETSSRWWGGCSDFAEWGRKISPGGHTNTESRFAPKLLFLYPVNDKDMRMV
ncbi:hypothetical protein TNCV_3555742 [Trichonephila clavipes]|nr:hypothetical protein TNCV_3555742 [Trichonephila clavipes]